MAADSFKKTVVSALGWSAAMKIAFQLVSWGLTLLVIRILSPRDYGLMAIAQVFTTFMLGFANLGLGDALVQREDAPRHLVASAFGVLLAMSLALTAILSAAAYPIAQWYGDARLVPLIQVSSLGFIFNALTTLPRMSLSKTLRVRPMFLAEFSSGLIGSITVIALAWTGFGVWSLMLGWLAMNLAKLAAFALVAPEFLLRPRLDLAAVRPLLGYGAYSTLEYLAWTMMTAADVLIVGRVLGAVDLGLYAVVLNFAAMPVNKIAPIVNAVAFPAFAMVQGRLADARFYVLKALRLMSVMAVPVFLGIGVTAPEIVDLVFGPKWAAARPLLSILSVALTFRALLILLPNYLQGIGDAKAAFWCTAVGATIFPHRRSDRLRLGHLRRLLRLARRLSRRLRRRSPHRLPPRLPVLPRNPAQPLQTAARRARHGRRRCRFPPLAPRRLARSRPPRLPRRHRRRRLRRHRPRRLPRPRRRTQGPGRPRPARMNPLAEPARQIAYQRKLAAQLGWRGALLFRAPCWGPASASTPASRSNSNPAPWPTPSTSASPPATPTSTPRSSWPRNTPPPPKATREPSSISAPMPDTPAPGSSAASPTPASSPWNPSPPTPPSASATSPPTATVRPSCTPPSGVPPPASSSNTTKATNGAPTSGPPATANKATSTPSTSPPSASPTSTSSRSTSKAARSASSAKAPNAGFPPSAPSPSNCMALRAKRPSVRRSRLTTSRSAARASLRFASAFTKHRKDLLFLKKKKQKDFTPMRVATLGEMHDVRAAER